MAKLPVETGPTGERVAANVAAIRRARGLNQRDLGDLLVQTGRNIQATVVSKIEKLDRRVDVDDLVALAIALRVSPNALLLPARVDRERIALTPQMWAAAVDAWLWATGEQRLPVILDERSARDGVSEAQFRRENRPYEPATDTDFVRYLMDRPALFEEIRRVSRSAQDDGVPLSAIAAYVKNLDSQIEPFVPSAPDQLAAYAVSLEQAKAEYARTSDPARKAKLEALINGLQLEIELSERARGEMHGEEDAE